MSDARIMIVEDESIVTEDIKNILQNLGYSVSSSASSGEAALTKAEETRPDLILMDIVLKGKMNGIDAAGRIRSLFDIPVVYLTAYADEKTLERAKKTEPFGYLVKPFDVRDLHSTIEIALYKSRMEKKLKESNAWFSTTLRSIGDAVIATDPKGNVVFINPIAQSLTGWNEEDAVGKTLKEVFNIMNEFTRKGVEDPVEKVIREGNIVGLANHTVLIARNGRELPIDDSAAPIKDDRGNTIGIVLVFRDITERRQAERDLFAEKERLAVTLRSIGDAVITTDVEGRIVILNQVAEKLTGWTHEEAAGRFLSEVFHIINEKTRERCANPAEKVIKAGVIVGLANHTVLIARDGKERIIADSGAPIRDKDGNVIGVVLVFRDITIQRKLEEELIKSKKIESLGILAGGIAHDFNNILTGIIGNISLAKTYSKPEDNIFARLTEAEKAGVRAKDLTKQLITFAKGGAPIKKTVSISELLNDTANFALRGSNVKCEFSLPSDLWWSEIDEGQISQVITNLIINADQAMPEGGVIKVLAENIIIRPANALPLKEGNYIKITIEDQGIGINQEHLHKIFDPYFTTKQKGSGLGLATTYSIIKNHDGLITAQSKVGVGSTFCLYLPASLEQPLNKDGEESPFVGTGKVLVMDDEEIVRDVLTEMLSRLGYQVSSSRDGAEAIEACKEAEEAGKPFDIAILDLTVPGGMGGKETIKEILRINPAVKAFVSSGYSNDPIMSEFRKYGFCGVIPKPYVINEVRKALAQ